MELARLALQAAAGVAARLLGLDGSAAHEVQSRVVASFGHRLYLNVALAVEIQRRVPAVPEKLAAVAPAWLKMIGPRGIVRSGGVALARYGRSERWVEYEAARVSASTPVATLTDAELDARIALLIDTFVDSEVVNVNAALVGAGTYAERVSVVVDDALGDTRVDDHAGRGQLVRGASAHIARQLLEALRQQGIRLATAGVLDDADDVFHLTTDELAYPPADVASTVRRRKRERDVLSRTALPSLITGDGKSIPAS